MGKEKQQVIGNSLYNLKKIITHFAKQGDNVLLVGAPGTGKELFANLYAKASDRYIMALNIAGLSASVIESELFGHTPGAFTGATMDRVGIFGAQAKNNALFFDELGDIPHEIQAKLLRVIQYGDYQKVGCDAAHRINIDEIRIVAATNKPHQIRNDLKDRFKCILVPRLIARKGDITALIKHFLKGTSITHITEETYKGLTQAEVSWGGTVPGGAVMHHWNGNVRELEGALKTAVFLCEQRGEKTLTKEDFPSINWQKISFSRDQLKLLREWEQLYRVNRNIKPRPDKSPKLKIKDLPVNKEPLPFNAFFPTEEDLREADDGNLLLRKEMAKIGRQIFYVGSEVQKIRENKLKESEKINFDKMHPDEYFKMFWKYHSDLGRKPSDIKRIFGSNPHTAKTNLGKAKRGELG
jgi:transcriptional regulator with GAF, ATPase, and Fis domain